MREQIQENYDKAAAHHAENVAALDEARDAMLKTQSAYRKLKSSAIASANAKAEAEKVLLSLPRAVEDDDDGDEDGDD